MTQPRIIQFGSHSLKSPTLFASYRMGDFPVAGLKFHPWAITETEALLINAYDFMRPKYQPVINNGWKPAKNLDFADKPILVDSGAYYFVRKNKVSVTPADVLDVQIKTKGDIGVVLDHPFPPEAKDKSKRIKTTLKNTADALEVRSRIGASLAILPVIHGHSTRAIRSCITELRRIYEKQEVGELTHVGIGSVAPLAQRKNMRLACKVISTVRKELPTAYIHCFSMGSALSMLLAFHSGADSVDSQSWIVGAAFKNAQLPGHYVKRMGAKDYPSKAAFKASMRMFAARLKKLVNEEDFFVKNWIDGKRMTLDSDQDFVDYTYSLVDSKSNEHIHNRACHNLWMYNYEVRNYREAQAEDRALDFVRSRLAGTSHSSLLAA